MRLVISSLLLALFGFFSEEVYAFQNSRCDFYRDLESSIPCGPTGYSAGYAEKYCEKFSSLDDGRTQQSLSANGLKWRDKTLMCLQNTMKNYLTYEPELSCKKIKRFGFSSHAYCYLTNPYSICDLPVSDWKVIIKTIQAHDIMSFTGLAQVYKVISKCTKSF